MTVYKIIALFGESCSGKNTVLRQMEESMKNVNICALTTNRPRREGERYGIDYYFTKDDKEFDDNCLLVSEYNNWKYGLDISKLSKDQVNIGIFNLQLLLQMQESPLFQLIPVYIFAPEKIRLKRGLRRNDNYYEMCRRFCADTEEYREKLPLIKSYINFYNVNEDRCNIMKVLESHKSLNNS